MDLHEFFRNEVKPALGCTEPISVAFCAAVARKYLHGDPESMRLAVSINIFKNARDVGIPGTGGLKGNELAAALGALAGKPELGLMVLRDVTAADVEKAKEFLARGKLDMRVMKDVPGVHTEVTLTGAGEEVVAVVKGRHDQIWSVTVNGEQVIGPAETAGVSASSVPTYSDELLAMDFQGLWDAAESLDAGLEEFMLQGVKMNMSVAAEGLKRSVGMGVGKAVMEMAMACGDDLACRVRGVAAAAADVRMSGEEMAVMSSAGSGNHGLTAILPIAAVAEAEGKSDRALAEAVALSHLVTGYIKAHTGRLTPICGCTVAAGAGAAAGLIKLMGGNPDQAERAAVTVISSLIGMICDGAKGSCGLKVATAASEAWNAAHLILAGSGITETQGVVTTQLGVTAKSLAEISAKGFCNVDGVLVDLMLDQQKDSLEP